MEILLYLGCFILVIVMGRACTYVPLKDGPTMVWATCQGCGTNVYHSNREHCKECKQKYYLIPTHDLRQVLANERIETGKKYVFQDKISNRLEKWRWSIYL